MTHKPEQTTSLDSVVQEEMAGFEGEEHDIRENKSKQNIVILVITLFVSALNAPWFYGEIGFAIGSFASPFLWSFLVVGVAGLIEKVHNMIFKQPWNKISKNYVNYSLRVALVFALIVFLPDFLEGVKHGMSNS